MNDKIKQNLDEITSDLSRARKTNALTYWAMLAFGGLLCNGVIILLLTKTGILLLVTASFIYIMNNLVNSWIEIRKAEIEAEDAARRAAAKASKPLKK